MHKIGEFFLCTVKHVFSYAGLVFLASLFRVLPFPVISQLSSGLAWTLRSVIRYRRQTAVENLTRAFPEKTLEDIDAMLPALYRNITDVFCETIWAFYARPAAILRHFTLPDATEIERLFGEYRGAVLASGHLANWEMCGFCFHEVIPSKGIVAYRSLKNPLVDRMVRRYRRKSKMHLASMPEVLRTVARKLAEPHYILLIADQSPDPEGAQWEEFFGQETAFFRGPAVIAHRYDIPVFFAYARRVRRHHYRLMIEPLFMEPTKTAPDEITRMYVRKLEEAIRRDPIAWLWTHRRWKHKREG